MDTTLVATLCFIVVLISFTLHYRGLYKKTLSQLSSVTHERDIDELTEVYSRVGFNRIAEKVYASHKRDPKTSIALAYIDIDNFKSVNDCHGHQFGDVVLKNFGEILLNCVRETDVVGRRGGDEFVVLFVSANGTDFNINKILTRVRRQFEKEMEELYSLTGSEQYPKVSMSFGVTQHKTGVNHNLSELINEADKILYLNKIRRGRCSR